MQDKKIAVMFSTRGSNVRVTMHRGRGLMLALLATAPRARRAFTEQRYTSNAICPRRDVPLFFSFPFSFLPPSPPLFILHEGISRCREIDRILCTLLPIKISFAWHTPLYRCLFIIFFSLNAYTVLFFFYEYLYICINQLMIIRFVVNLSQFW